MSTQLQRKKTGPSERRTIRPGLETLEERDVPTVTFANAATFAAGSGPHAVMVGDFNGDGRPDVASSNEGSNTVSVFLNTTAVGAATTTFAAQQTFAVGASPDYGAVGDLNGDGRSDIVIANSGNLVSVLLNATPIGASTASFAAQQIFVGPFGNFSVALGDINGDGRLDLALANQATTTLSVLLNTTPAGAATASFAAEQTFTVGLNPISVVMADINGDGRTDLAAGNTNSFSPTLSVLLNTTQAGAATPSFTAQQTFALDTTPFVLATGDFNGDGRRDLAVGFNNVSTVSVLRNTTATGATTPTFAAQQKFNVEPGPAGVGVGDFNGDGRADLATANFVNSTVSVLENTTAIGATTFVFAAQQTFTVGNAPYAAAVADFNGDGRPDIATGHTASNNVCVLRNTTTPFASTIPTVAVAIPGFGVWQFNRLQGWLQLSAANASLVVCNAAGTIVGNFTGNGLWQYKPTTGWQTLGTADATALAIDANGNVAANFAGFGMYHYRPASGWQSLGTADANLIALDALGNIYANFVGYGIWRFRAAVGWQQLNGTDATLIAVNANGDLVANFTNYGIGFFRPYSGWSSLSGVSATALTIDANGNVTASFQSYGVNLYRPTLGWASLAPSIATLLSSDAYGNIYGQFTGYGIIVYVPTQGWVTLGTGDVSKLFVA